MQKNATSHLKSQAIYIDGKSRTDEIETYNFFGKKCTITDKNNSKSYSYNESRIQIVKSPIQTKNAESIFCYLKEVAESVGLTPEEGSNILAKSYERIMFFQEKSILFYHPAQKVTSE